MTIPRKKIAGSKSGRYPVPEVDSIYNAEVETRVGDQTEEFRDLILQLWDQAIPPRFRNVRIELIAKSVRQEVVDSISELLSRNPRGLLLVGNPGVGKTGAMFCILRHFLVSTFLEQIKREQFMQDAMYKCFHCYEFVTQLELVRILRKFYSDSNESHYPKIFRKPVVFLDDLGRGSGNSWNQELLDEFIDYRYSHNLPIIASTNVSKEQLNEQSEWKRIVDRLADNKWIKSVTLDGLSRRRM